MAIIIEDVVAPSALVDGGGCPGTSHNLTQVSTIGALLNRVYDGVVTLHDLIQHGDFGIGTFDHLDGEMIVLDGQVYQVKDTGAVIKPELSLTTPFAVVTSFVVDEQHDITPGTTFSRFESEEDSYLPTQNIFHAIRITGTFSTMLCRSVSRQEKPYPPLSEVAKRESIFEFENVSGTIVGFRCPQYVAGINLPGYHLHFISHDHTAGGHVLDFTVSNGVAAADYTPGFSMMLPQSEAFYATDFSRDDADALGAIERDVPHDAHVVTHR